MNELKKIIELSIKLLFIQPIDVDSDLPEDLREQALLCFEAAVSNHMNVGDAISKVQKDVLSKCDERFKGQRYKGFIKFDYDTNVISIQVRQ